MQRGNRQHHAKPKGELPSPSSLTVHASATFRKIAVGSITCESALEYVDR